MEGDEAEGSRGRAAGPRPSPLLLCTAVGFNAHASARTCLAKLMVLRLAASSLVVLLSLPSQVMDGAPQRSARLITFC